MRCASERNNTTSSIYAGTPFARLSRLALLSVVRALRAASTLHVARRLSHSCDARGYGKSVVKSGDALPLFSPRTCATLAINAAMFCTAAHNLRCCAFERCAACAPLHLLRISHVHALASRTARDVRISAAYAHFAGCKSREDILSAAKLSFALCKTAAVPVRMRAQTKRACAGWRKYHTGRTRILRRLFLRCCRINAWGHAALVRCARTPARRRHA